MGFGPATKRLKVKDVVVVATARILDSVPRSDEPVSLPARTRNPALDALRCAAILLVVFNHVLPHEIGDQQIVGAISTLTQRGVDLFFVLSGYLVGGIAIREVASTGRLRILRFWQRRWMRTLPAYYMTLGLFALKQLLPHRSAGLIKPWAYVVFLQVYVLESLADFTHSWSLCVEEHFYLVFPLLLAALAALKLSRARHIALVIVSLAVAFATYRFVVLGTDSNGLDRLTHYRTDALSIGILVACVEAHVGDLAIVVARQRATLMILGVTLVLTAAVVNLAESALCSALWQTAFAVAFGVWVFLGAGRMGVLAKLGVARPVAFIARISYSLYLLHPLVIGSLDQLYFRKRPETIPTYIVFVILAFGASIIAATISYRLVERPCLSLRDRLVPHRSDVSQPG